LKNITKVINLFTSIFSNSSKYNHSVYHFLKIFYERSSKSYSLYSILGNVFKNSKWTNYKMQNIKLSFVLSFFKLLISTITILILLFSLKTNSILVCNLFNNTLLLFLKDALCDYTSFLISIVLIYLYSIKIYIKNFYLYLLSPSNTKILKDTRLIYYISYINNSFPLGSIDFSFSNNFNYVLNVQYLLLLRTLFKIKNNLFWINFSDSWIDKALNNNNNFIYEINGKLFVNLNNTPKNTFYRFALKDLHKSCTNMINIPNNFSSSTNPNFLYKLNKNFFNLSLIENIMDSSINITKQTRWLTRNIMLSDRFIINTNYFTEYKKLLGSNITISNLSNNNVWASSNLNRINFKKMYSLFSNYNNNFNFSCVINNFDESRLWLFKKIYFNTLLKHCNTILTFCLNTDFFKNNSFDNNFYFEIAKISLTYNLHFFDNSIKFNYESQQSKDFAINNSNFNYNINDYNLLCDENLDKLINLFANNNFNSQNFYFYSNLDLDSFNSHNNDFSISYKI
jgi:hypothetical protein